MSLSSYCEFIDTLDLFLSCGIKVHQLDKLSRPAKEFAALVIKLYDLSRATRQTDLTAVVSNISAVYAWQLLDKDKFAEFFISEPIINTYILAELKCKYQQDLANLVGFCITANKLYGLLTPFYANVLPLNKLVSKAYILDCDCKFSDPGQTLRESKKFGIKSERVGVSHTCHVSECVRSLLHKKVQFFNTTHPSKINSTNLLAYFNWIHKVAYALHYGATNIAALSPNASTAAILSVAAAYLYHVSGEQIYIKDILPDHGINALMGHFPELAANLGSLVEWQATTPQAAPLPVSQMQSPTAAFLIADL